MNPEGDTSNAELRVLLKEQIDARPENFRGVLVLREVEGLSFSETSEPSVSPKMPCARVPSAREERRAAIHRVDNGALREAYGFHLSRCDRVVAAGFKRLTAN